MSFDFNALETNVEDSLNTDLLFVAVLGSSGNGKSRVCGTLPGKTLYLYAGGERHGVASGKAAGGTLVPNQVDFNYAKKAMYTPDEAYTNLLNILKSAENMAKSGYKNVVVDGLTELEQLIRGTKAFRDRCKTANGGANPYAEPAATVDMMRPILDELRNLQRTNKVNVAVTCLLDVKALGDKKEVLEASPKLTSYGVASSLIPQFDDILVIGRMQEDDGPVEYNFQMCGNVSRTSKEVNGRVKKMMNFSPRISVSNHGVEIPEYIPANFAEILKIKQMVKGVKK